MYINVLAACIAFVCKRIALSNFYELKGTAERVGVRIYNLALKFCISYRAVVCRISSVAIRNVGNSRKQTCTRGENRQ